MGFDHERLDVYQAALEFVVLGNDVVEQLPRGRAYLADQLQRAATSVPLNIAEGAGEYRSKEKARFYRIARRSATECAAVIDILGRLKAAQDADLRKANQILFEIVSMLTGMVKRLDGLKR